MPLARLGDYHMAIILILLLLPTHFGIPPPPFRVSINSSSAEDFLLTRRPDTSRQQYNPQKGEKGSLEMIFISETDQTPQLEPCLGPRAEPPQRPLDGLVR